MARLTLEEIKRLVELRSKKERSTLNCFVLEAGNIQNFLKNYKAGEKQRLQLIFSVEIPVLEMNAAPDFHWSVIDILFDKNSNEAESVFFLDSVSIKWVEKAIEAINSVYPNIKKKYYAKGFQVDDNSCSVFATTFCFDLAKISDLHEMLSRTKKEKDIENKMWHIHKSDFTGKMIGLLRFTQSRLQLDCLMEKFKDKSVNKRGATFFNYVSEHDIKKEHPKLAKTSQGRQALYFLNGFDIDNYSILYKYKKYKKELKEALNPRCKP